MVSSVMRVIISSQAYLSIISETYSFLDIETGGIFLGCYKDNTWYVLEVIDPGYKDTTRQEAYFEYDVDYVTHLANVKKRLYSIDLQLLGLWHRHPGSFDRFSSTDDGTNMRFAELLPNGAISAIVNLDPDFRLTMYHAALPLKYSRVNNVLIGDSHIPAYLTKMKDPSDVLPIDNKIVDNQAISGSIFSRLKIKYFKPKKDVNSIDGKKSKEVVLSMLEIEQQKYLENQADYSYDVKMVGDTIEMRLKYLGNDHSYPELVSCIFLCDKEEGIVIIDNCRHNYKPQIIRKYISDIVQSFKDEDQLSIKYRKTLGLYGDYNEKNLKKAYRVMMKNYHPDTWFNEKNEELITRATIKTKQIQEAYQFLLKKMNN